MSRLRRASAAMSVVLIALLLAAMAVPAPVRAEGVGAPFVLRVLETLRENYVDRLSSPQLLNAALESLRQQLNAAPFGEPIPSGVGDNEAAALFTQRFDQILSQVPGDRPTIELAFAAAGGMLESLHDSHTGFIPPQVFQEEKRRENGQAAFTGIGIVLLSRDGEFYVSEVYPGSPAEAAGLRSFDQVLAVNGRTTSGLKETDVSALIRGQAGTRVVLTLGRPGAGQPMEVPIVRGPIMIPGVASKMLQGGVGYLRLYEFLPRAGKAFREAVFGLRRNGMQALVLDMRGNPGGLVEELRNISGALLPPNSPFLQMRTRGGRHVMLETSDPPIVPSSIPIVALVDDETGSAAELLAAALQEHGRGVITGVKTAGAVEIGITVTLPEGAGMSVTVARVLTGKGVRLEGQGVTPDVAESLTTDAIKLGRDSQLDRALEVVRKTLELSSLDRSPAVLGTIAR